MKNVFFSISVPEPTPKVAMLVPEPTLKVAMLVRGLALKFAVLVRGPSQIFPKFVLRLRWRLACFFFAGRVQEFFPIVSEPISEFSGHFRANFRVFYTISGIFVPGPSTKIGPFVLGPYLNILVLPLDLVPKNEICP